MALKTLSALPVFADSLFADRFNRIDRLFSQLTGDTPVGKGNIDQILRRSEPQRRKEQSHER